MRPPLFLSTLLRPSDRHCIAKDIGQISMVLQPGDKLDEQFSGLAVSCRAYNTPALLCDAVLKRATVSLSSLNCGCYSFVRYHPLLASHLSSCV